MAKENDKVINDDERKEMIQKSVYKFRNEVISQEIDKLPLSFIDKCELRSFFNRKSSKWAEADAFNDIFNRRDIDEDFLFGRKAENKFIKDIVEEFKLDDLKCMEIMNVVGLKEILDESLGKSRYDNRCLVYDQYQEEMLIPAIGKVEEKT